MIKLVIGIDLDDTLTETSKLANKILHENDKYKDLEDFHPEFDSCILLKT